MADAQNTDAQSARVGAFEYVLSRNNASEDSVRMNSDIHAMNNRTVGLFIDLSDPWFKEYNW
jgi:hypothetical protein